MLSHRNTPSALLSAALDAIDAAEPGDDGVRAPLDSWTPLVEVALADAVTDAVTGEGA